MNLVKRKPRCTHGVPLLFEDFFTNNDFFLSPSRCMGDPDTLPAVNIKENDADLTIEVAAPGFKKKDFNIELNDDLLTISSEKEVRSENTSKNENYMRKEFVYSSFHRSFNLSNEVLNVDKITAEYMDGILLINIPKRKEKKKPTRTISVN